MPEADRDSTPSSEQVPEAKRGITRRQLLQVGVGCALAAGAAGWLARGAVPARPSRPAGRLSSAAGSAKWVRRARYYRKLPGKAVQCELCPKQCSVARNGRGFCEVRENRDGEYYTLVYGRAASVNVDPIEKKPFFHVLPGNPVFSFAAAGCNMECKNCQNWQLSQARPEAVPAADLPPAKLVAAARSQDCSLIAGTYTEPTVFAEYLLDVAREGNKLGLRTTMVSSGFINRRPMLDLTGELAAVKVDLKSMRDDFYRSNCMGMLRPVLDTIELVKRRGVWLEIVYLVIPTLNDSDKEIRDLAGWLRTHVGPDVPLHFSRFHPQYRLKSLPPTPYRTLDRCYEIARAEGIHYVYVGNLPGHPAESTFCPKCKKLLIKRQMFLVRENHLKNGCCSSCGHPIPGLWS